MVFEVHAIKKIYIYIYPLRAELFTFSRIRYLRKLMKTLFSWFLEWCICFYLFMKSGLIFYQQLFGAWWKRKKKILHPICSLAKYINALSKHIPRRSCQINFYKYAFFALILFLSFNYWYLSLKNKTKRKKSIIITIRKNIKYIFPRFLIYQSSACFLFS